MNAKWFKLNIPFTPTHTLGNMPIECMGIDAGGDVWFKVYDLNCYRLYKITSLDVRSTIKRNDKRSKFARTPVMCGTHLTFATLQTKFGRVTGYIPGCGDSPCNPKPTTYASPVNKVTPAKKLSASQSKRTKRVATRVKTRQ